MSYLCESCDVPIDAADHYAVCTDPWGGNPTILCEHCRERGWDAHQESLMENGGGPSLIEQQRAAHKIKHGIRS